MKSLAEIAAGVEGDKALSRRKRQNVISSLHTFARATGRRLEELPANPRALRDRSKSLTAAQAGVSPGRLANIRSDVTFALRHGGVGCMAGRSQEPISAGWAALHTLCGDKATWTGISRFARNCTGHRIEPEDVTPATFEDYRAELEAGLLVKNPSVTHRITCRAWNKAGDTVQGWPAVRAVLADNRGILIQPWEVFPASLKAQLEAFIRDKTDPDILTDRRSAPWRPGTAQTRCYQARQYLAALVRLGHDPKDLCAFADILRPDLAKAALLEIQGRKPEAEVDGAAPNTRQVHGIACLLRMAAVWSGAPAEVVKPLSGFCSRLEMKEVTLTAKNHDRLRPLEDPKLRLALQQLAFTIFNRKSRRLKPYRRAVEVETALMIEILLMVPLRVGNLAGLDLDRHLSRPGKDGCFYITIPAAEVKNKVDLRFPLPKETSRLIDIYREKYRPLLLDGASNALFPGRGGGAKHVRSVSGNITDLLKRELGLTFNPHAFRHLAAYTFLKANPGQYEIVRRLLGHRNIATTIAYYCGLENDAALKLFSETVSRERGEVDGPSPRGRGK